MSRPPEASWIPAILMSSAAYRLGTNQGLVAAMPPAVAVVLRNFRRLTRVVIVPLRVMVRTPRYRRSLGRLERADDLVHRSAQAFSAECDLLIWGGDDWRSAPRDGQHDRASRPSQ